MQLNNDGADKEEVEIGAFDDSNPEDVWYVRAGVEVSFFVEGAEVAGREGIAAVLAVGILCLEDHGKANEEVEVHPDGDNDGQDVEELQL
ncbi:hypothetical protein ACLMJK_003746 [Lecanora helva]